MQHQVGSDSQGQVFQAPRIKGNKPVAVKIYRGKTKEAKLRYILESEISQAVNSPNLLNAVNILGGLKRSYIVFTDMEMDLNRLCHVLKVKCREFNTRDHKASARGSAFLAQCGKTAQRFETWQHFGQLRAG